MPLDGGNLIFYAVLIAPGFIAVMTTVRLAALEDEIPSFVLLVWSLVLSLVIDTLFLSLYQWWHGPVTSYEQMSGILFDPFFRVDYILGIFSLSLLIGVLGALGVIVDVPGRARGVLQSRSRVKYSPHQPWANFMDDAVSVRVKTSDDQLYIGTVTEWSRAGRPKELRIKEPFRYNKNISDFESVAETGKEEMLFLEKDIDRIVLLTHDMMPGWWSRMKGRIGFPDEDFVAWQDWLDELDKNDAAEGDDD